MQIPNQGERENEGAWTVAAVLGGDRPERRDVVGAPDGTHDFDITIRRRVVALEISSTTVPEVAQMWHVIHDLDWQFPDLPESWSISLHASARGQAGPLVRRFHERAPLLLRQIHDEHPNPVGNFLYDPDRDGLSERTRYAVKELRKLGARSGGTVGTMTGSPPSICISTVGTWASDHSSVHGAVEREAINNAEKLGRATADERHLLLWVDDSDPASLQELTTIQLPTEQPVLPAGIDVVWVALWMRRINP
jgi:hypothetical protein